jgi:hypothetical protein
MGEIFATIKRITENPSLYKEMAEKAKAKAEEYHIDHIAKLYLSLPGG